MAATRNSDFDGPFYQPADKFFPENHYVGLTFDDITLATQFSDILPRDTQLDTHIADGLSLNIPVISSDMDTVTESRMAIAMALNGGLGLIHYNLPEREQLSEVSRVKNHVHGLIQEPIKVSPGQFIGDVLAMIEQKKFGFSTFPVVDEKGKLLGLLPGHVVKPRYAKRKVAEALQPRAQVQTINQKELGKDPITRADKFFTEHLGIHKLLVVDDKDRLCGLITLNDVEHITQERRAQFKPARDERFRLVCGAAVSATRNAFGELDRDRVLSHVGGLVERGVDVIAVSTAHGHSKGVGDTVKVLRDAFPKLPIIAGNVTSAAGVEYLADCGADAIKVGQGPGSICTTRIVAGVGIPQMTALYTCSRAAARKKVSILGDGGITKSGDIVKALTLSEAVICGGIFAGCNEAPGEVVEISGKFYKQYRGMGSLAAMKAGSAARYGHEKNPAQKVAPEGVEALKEACGSVDRVLAQLIGGIQSGMGYLGAKTLEQLRQKARYIRVSPAGMREAAPHDVVELKTGN
ncbi:MAG TPA: IMP dehydrogenase [Candidatus Acidoferrales bacterium]|jgi:IMP dehydrogenase|nr:IMP dehydrogenase [Candidatus Acidoferrales bacterium]